MRLPPRSERSLDGLGRRAEHAGADLRAQKRPSALRHDFIRSRSASTRVRTSVSRFANRSAPSSLSIAWAFAPAPHSMDRLRSDPWTRRGCTTVRRAETVEARISSDRRPWPMGREGPLRVFLGAGSELALSIGDSPFKFRYFSQCNFNDLSLFPVKNLVMILRRGREMSTIGQPKSRTTWRSGLRRTTSPSETRRRSSSRCASSTTRCPDLDAAAIDTSDDAPRQEAPRADRHRSDDRRHRGGGAREPRARRRRRGARLRVRPRRASARCTSAPARDDQPPPTPSATSAPSDSSCSATSASSRRAAA